MNLFSKIKPPFLFICLTIYMFYIAPISTIHAADLVPLPPKRPAKMSASPAYIKELMNRRNPIKQIDNDVIGIVIDTDIDIADIDSQKLVDIFDNKKHKKIASIPIPTKKPVHLNNIEPAAASTYDDDENQSTLVSFSLKPEQINLDDNLKLFLKKHALNLFNRDKNLKMRIQAYATEIKGEQHSDIRISLARALEVRSFLISNNINPSRLMLSPNGIDKSNKTSNRIDLIFIKSK